MAEQILFVDDEPNVLRSIQRMLRKRYTLKTAASGKKALAMMEEEGPFAVVVSDMQMPEMNGAEFLSRVKEEAPRTVRIMLTGNADQQTAIDAVNQGDILRFLNKPTSAEGLCSALDAGLEHHRLLMAEQELLQNTLRGSIEALTEVLALSNPEVFGRCSRIKSNVVKVASKLEVSNMWEFETIAMLSQIGCASLQPDLMRKVLVGEFMEDDELEAYSEHARSGADLLDKIPRMEAIANAVRYQEKFFDGSGYPQDEVSGEELPLGSRVLRAVLDLDALEMAGNSTPDALMKMTQARNKYDPQVLDALTSAVCSTSEMELKTVSITALTRDMYLAADLCTSSGTLLVVMGQHTTQSVKQHLMSYYKTGLIESEVEVWVEVDTEKAQHITV